MKLTTLNLRNSIGMLHLQDFIPSKRSYDIIWFQWVVGHLTDGMSIGQSKCLPISPRELRPKNSALISLYAIQNDLLASSDLLIFEYLSATLDDEGHDKYHSKRAPSSYFHLLYESTLPLN